MNYLLNKILVFILLSFCFSANAQEIISNLKKTKSGVVIVEVNSDFNSKNSVSFLSQLKDCKAFRIDLSNANALKVKTVPTLIIFDSGQEKRRFEANIMMKCEATYNDVQNAINEIILNKFQ
jgi:hypothetical protein|tara:strand:+ start:1026 stop:1391 length:366 start_codon:yes stop_codon:yes gene_type:complete